MDVEGFSNLELSLKGIKSDLVVKIYNPNPISFDITSADITLSVGEIVSGDLVIEKSFKLSSKDTTDVTLKLVSRKGAIGKIIVDNFTNALSGSEILFKADGEIVTSIFGLTRKCPVNYEEKNRRVTTPISRVIFLMALSHHLSGLLGFGRNWNNTLR